MNNIKIAVVGNGTMGHGIAEVFAKTGYEVTVVGRSQKSIDNAKKRVESSLAEFVKEGLVREADVESIVNRVTFTTNIEDIKDAKIVIEALPEDMKLKEDIFGKLEKICKEDTIFGTASGHSVSEVYGQVEKKDRTIATHFWFPPQLLPLVEVCGAPETSKETIDFVCELLTNIGKKPVVIDKEIDGFIGNRIQFAALREAWSLWSKGVATADAIDAIVRYSIGRRYAVTGPIESADVAGLPVMVNFAAYLQPSLSVEKNPPKELWDLAKVDGKVYNRSQEEVDKLLKDRKDELFRWLAADNKEE